MSLDVPLMLLEIAGIGMLLNILSTVLLRLNVATDSDIFGQMFAKPMLGSVTGMPFLNAKYFAPWKRSPEFLDEEGLWIRTLFQLARIGGTVMTLGVVSFLISVVYIGTLGQS
nr:hypothetical protein [uncultured bacterium]